MYKIRIKNISLGRTHTKRVSILFFPSQQYRGGLLLGSVVFLGFLLKIGQGHFWVGVNPAK